MAEALAALGAFSSALQVVECFAKLISRMKNLVSSTRGELQEHDNLESLATEYRVLGSASSKPTRGENDLISADQDELEELTTDHLRLSNLLRPLRHAQAPTKREQNILRLGLACEKESKELLEQLGALKIDPEAPCGRRFIRAGKAAAKSLYHKKDVERRRKHLEELNGQLATAILLSMHEQPRYQGSSMDNICGDDIHKVLLLLQQTKAELLVESLRFPEMDSRCSSVEQAFPETYGWALKGQSGLPLWFRDGAGIFWVTGKAGSGKSTLMRFLSDHDSVRRSLEAWSGASRLMVATFFFWYAGTTLQKSIIGLIRTILFQVLSQDRKLVPAVFPKEVENFNGSTAKDWTYEDLVGRITRLANVNAGEISDKKFCLFVDGLDEYHGNHLELVTLLRNLARNPQFKLCVSSRPWNAFRHTLGVECPHLSMEDLTRPDIYRYVDKQILDALAHCPYVRPGCDRQEPDTLIREVVDKAEGVFLWVRLVVASVVKGLSEGDPISMLRHRVRSFPADLDEFFASILSRVDSVYEAQTHQALHLACKYIEHEGFGKHSTFYDYWLICQDPAGIKDTAFAYDVIPRIVSDDEAISMVAQTRNMLSSACKDLLYVPTASSNSQGWKSLDAKVAFLHRTVYDFLQSGKMQDLMKLRAPKHFEGQDILHLLNLARLKVTLHSPNKPTLVRSFWRNFSSDSVDSGHNQLTEEYLNEIAAIITYFFNVKGLEQHLLMRSGLLRCFLAFPGSNVGAQYLKSLWPYEWESERPEEEIDRFFLAALGEDPRNTFELDQVSLECIQMLCKKGVRTSWTTKWRPDHWGADFSWSLCASNCWRLFLHKWESFARDKGPVSQPVLRHFWEIAKAFLRTHVFALESPQNPWPVLIPACSCKVAETSSDGQRHPVYSFIKDQVPETWLFETIDTDPEEEKRGSQPQYDFELRIEKWRKSDAHGRSDQQEQIKPEKRRLETPENRGSVKKRRGSG